MKPSIHLLEIVQRSPTGKIIYREIPYDSNYYPGNDAFEAADLWYPVEEYGLPANVVRPKNEMQALKWILQNDCKQEYLAPLISRVATDFKLLIEFRHQKSFHHVEYARPSAGNSYTRTK